MIRKETIKKTRDFLNAAKRNLPAINKGHISPQEVAMCCDVSRARFGAAVDMGLFEPVSRRGRGFVYKSTVPYFNEDMAAAAIRHEYNMYHAGERGNKKTPSLLDELRALAEPSNYKEVSEPSPRQENVDAVEILKDAGYKGLLFRNNKALSEVEIVVL